LFAIAAAQQRPTAPPWDRREVPEAIERDPALARRIWVAQVISHLNMTADTPRSWRIGLSVAALYSAERMFASELIPSLERLTREDESVRTFRGKEAPIEHYYIRSLAARILTEKTGKVYSFEDVDGRTHPGGWDPSQEGAQ